MLNYMNQQVQLPLTKPSEQPYYYYPTWAVPQQHHQQPSPPQQHLHHQHTFVVEQHQQPSPPSPPQDQQVPPLPRPKITQSIWEDQNTFCYQVDARGICVARRQDNDMVNGTKLLNVTGISRGKRDGILKNENGRVVVKVGAMHLKGVWITFTRAKALAIQFNIEKLLHPLFDDDLSRCYDQQQPLPQQPYMNPPFYISPTPPPPQQQQQQQQPSQHQQLEAMIATPATFATLTTASMSSLELSQTQHFPYPYSDEWDLPLSSVLSDSAPGTPDVASMYPPHDPSAAAMTMGLSPYSFTSMMSLPQTAEADMYYHYGY